jgi:hypothetical protein
VIQAVWQVQRGCRTYCYGTSQWQRSTQWSSTSQSATAVSEGGGSGGAGAGARNESSTIQFVWQMQIGCVAFCFHTSQTQEASQQASTTQEAVAQSTLLSWAENIAETVQLVFQLQQGCERECHGTSQSQLVSQSQSTSQTSAAASPGWDGGGALMPDWLLAFAANVGATIQMTYQYQEALCLDHCTGDAQVQEAIQRADTHQLALAEAPPAPVEPPPAGEPPGGEAPAPGAPSGAGPIAAPSVVDTFAVTAGRRVATLGRKGRSRSRRREIVLRAVTRTAGETSTTSGVVSPAGAPATASTAEATLTLADRRATGTVEVVTDPAGDQLPPRTFLTPAEDSDGSLAWLLIALLAAPAGLFSVRLASNLTRI